MTESKPDDPDWQRFVDERIHRIDVWDSTFQQRAPALEVRDTTQQPAIVICTDPPSVWVADHLAWDQAAKIFWNAVSRIAGQPAPFPDAD